MKKLLYITTNIDNSGGVAKLLSVKLNYLLKTFGYQIEIINSNEILNGVFYPFDKQIKIHSLGFNELKITNLGSYRKRLKELIEEIDPDLIVNCDNGFKGALLPFLVKFRVPVLYENHNVKSAKGNSFKASLKLKLSFTILRLSAKRYSHLIVYPYDLHNWNHKNVVGISNPLLIDLPQTGSYLNNKTAIAIGRVSHQKGYDNLIKIWGIVAQKHPDWKLKIYGEGRRDTLRDLIRDLNISKQVEFCEPVLDLKTVYLNASMILNTSKYEPFGLALLEGMACGLPAIAFENTSGPSSYITNNENGFLVKEDDLQLFADRVSFLIENEPEIKRLSIKAREVAKDYDLHKVMNTWHKLFRTN